MAGPGDILPPSNNSLESQVASPTPPVPSPPRDTIFRGPDGIRAGWRVLIFVCLVVAMAVFGAIVAGILLGLLYGPAAASHLSLSTITPLGLGLSEGAILLTTVVAALIMTRIEHRRFSEFGLPIGSAFQKDFWIGGFAGFLAISGSLLGIFAFHGFRVEGWAIHSSTIVAATASWSAAFIVVGLAEEFGFRGYLQYTLTTGIGFWPAAVVTSLLFGLAHRGNPGETYFGLISVVLFGLLFCFFLRRTGSLWWAVGFHAGWDWGQTFFYGVRDSGIVPYHNLLNSSFNGPEWLTGGSVGPEASVFTPLVLAIVAILFSQVYRRRDFEKIESLSQ